MNQKTDAPSTNTVDLKPCPHCGGTDLQGPVISDMGDRARSEYAWIECRNCPGGVEVFSTSAHMATEADAIAAWNRRALEPVADMVAGDTLPITLFQFESRAQFLLTDEQRKPNPDNALIDFICNAIRLARENERLAKAPIELAEYVRQLEAIAEVASRVHIAMAADSASDEGHDEGPGAEDHSEYLIMEAEEQLQAALKPWRERRNTPTKSAVRCTVCGSTEVVEGSSAGPRCATHAIWSPNEQGQMVRQPENEGGK